LIHLLTVFASLLEVQMQKDPPDYSLDLVLHPQNDSAYKHFEDGTTNPFEANAAGIPRVNAWWLAEAALLTYWKPEDAIPIFQKAGFDAQYVREDSTDCYVASQKDWVVVAFRGTEPDEWADILADANLVLVPWQTGAVHLGFKRAFDAVRPRLDSILKTAAQGRTLWFCGHSLGAALATLAADHYSTTRGVCTFGSPRVGDSTFASGFNAQLAGKSLRYVNDHDVVTHVPLPPLYKHVDARRFIAPDGTVSGGQPTIAHFFADLIGQPRHLLETIEALRGGTVRTAPVFLLDHMPKAYAIWTWNDYDANG
jgi:triacylglycerol lipase